jgi:hypothetical protein
VVNEKYLTSQCHIFFKWRTAHNTSPGEHAKVQDIFYLHATFSSLAKW